MKPGRSSRRGAPQANGVDHVASRGEARTLIPVSLATAQVVQVRHRQAGQALKARIPMHMQHPPEQMRGGRARERAVGAVHLGQQPGELGARVAAGGQQVAQHHAPIWPIQAGIGKTLGRRDDVGVAGIITVAHTKVHLQRAGQEGLKLGNSLQTGLVHVDHHAKNDQPKRPFQAHTSLDKAAA